MTKNVIVTRPKVVMRLLDAGVEGRQVSNPWSPGRTAWLFPFTDQTYEIIKEFYDENGLDLPRSYQREQDGIKR